MNKLKELEDRYSENRRNTHDPRAWLKGIFDGIYCEKCGKEHGSKHENGEAVILTVVGNKALCFRDGIEHAKSVAKPKVGRPKQDHLKEFGLKQEVLL